MSEANPTTAAQPTQDTPTVQHSVTSESAEQDPKSGLRKIWPFNKKKEEVKGNKVDEPTTTKAPPPAALKGISPASLPANLNPSMSPGHSQSGFGVPGSPGQGGTQASPPRAQSPASSLIFERNVQDDGLAGIASPAIPSHITTENHIPPVLDVATNTITDKGVDPDAVEIVTHSAHLPASITVAANASHTDLGRKSPPSQLGDATYSPATDEPASFSSSPPYSSPDFPNNMSASQTTAGNTAGYSEDTAASNYGSLDSNDMRRLSFISFADVVHAEHAQHDPAHALHPAGTSIASPRSPSPVRSPISSAYATSPGLPMSGIAPTSSPRPMGEPSPSRAAFAKSPVSPAFPISPGELNVETMTQALRKTGSRDLSSVRGGSVSVLGGTAGSISGLSDEDGTKIPA